MKTSNRGKKEKGFTIIELVTVISIILIIFIVLICVIIPTGDMVIINDAKDIYVNFIIESNGVYNQNNSVIAINNNGKITYVEKQDNEFVIVDKDSVKLTLLNPKCLIISSEAFIESNSEVNHDTLEILSDAGYINTKIIQIGSSYKIDNIDTYLYSSLSTSNIIFIKNTDVTEKSLGLEYTSNEDGTCYVSGIGTCKSSNILIPTTSPAGDIITSIGYGAFARCSNLTNITISSSVISIEKEAFNNCSKLESVSFEQNSQLKDIGEYAFEYCSSLKSLTIPNNLENIDEYAFEYCSNLTSVKIPRSVTSIGSSVFYGCRNLINIEVEDNNENYKSIDGNLYSKDGKTLIQYAIGKTATEFKIANSVDSVGDRAFAWCSSLTNIEIPNSVISIGLDVFSYCNSLTSIIIPDSVISICNYTFRGCSKLESVVIPISLNSISFYAFSGCSSLAKVYYVGTESDWSNIGINSSGNGALESATIYYYSATNPVGEGNFWHYDTDGITIVEW